MKTFLSTVALLTVIVTSAFAKSFDPAKGTGNVLASSQNALANEKTAVRHGGLHSFGMVPPLESSRVQPFDNRGTSEYPFGPGYNFPYPDRPYGDPDHW